MASFEQHRDKWRAQVKINGVREKKSFPTKAAAQAWAKAREAELKAADGGQGWRTVRELFETYAERVSEKKDGKKWEQSRIIFFLKSNPDLADKPLSDLTSEHMGKWRDRRMAGDPARKIKAVANATVEREINLFSNIFHTARREWKWIDESPLTDVKRPPPTLPRTQRVDEEASGHKDINILQEVYYAPKVQTLANKLRGKSAT